MATTGKELTDRVVWVIKEAQRRGCSPEVARGLGRAEWDRATPAEREQAQAFAAIAAASR